MTAASQTLTVPCSRPLMTSNDQRRMLWPQQAKLIRQMQQQVQVALSRCPIATQSAPIGIQVTWYPPNRVTRDHDSLNPFRKAAQDALVKAGVIPDDDARYVAWGLTAIGPPDKANPRIEITITPASSCWVCSETRPAPPVCGPQRHITDADEELADHYARGDHA